VALQRDFSDTGTIEPVELKLPRTAVVTDLRDGKSSGRVNSVTVSLDGIEPAVLKLSDQPG
jgi:hypothetical protein